MEYMVHWNSNKLNTALYN